jgi:adenylate kinase
MNIIILGAQGSGKGTQAKFLSEKYGLPHISTGDIFREAAEKKIELGLKAKSHWEKGSLVPDEITIGIVKERLSRPDCGQGFVLDGFPRTLAQAEGLDEFAQVDAVIELKISDDDAVKRLSGRRQCRKCSAVYGPENPSKKAGKCGNCGGELYQRDDDKPDVIKKRLGIYHEETEPLLEYYKPRKIVYAVDASKSIKEVFASVCKIIEEAVL